MTRLKYLICQLIGVYVLMKAVDSLDSCDDPGWSFFAEGECCLKASEEHSTLDNLVNENISNVCTDLFPPTDGFTNRLVNIRSQAMLNFIMKNVIGSDRDGASFWIGLYKDEGAYVTSTGEEAEFTAWKNPEMPAVGLCVKLYQGFYYPTICGDYLSPICELLDATTAARTTTTAKPFVCEEGYEIAGERRCRDINECTENNGGCAHICKNTNGSHTCVCMDGYQLIYGGNRCTDIDECMVGGTNGGCDHVCRNLIGTRLCSCRQGYKIVNSTKCHSKYGHLHNNANLGLILLACLSPLALLLLICLPFIIAEAKASKYRDGSLKSESSATIVQAADGAATGSHDSSAYSTASSVGGNTTDYRLSALTSSIDKMPPVVKPSKMVHVKHHAALSPTDSKPAPIEEDPEPPEKPLEYGEEPG